MKYKFLLIQLLWLTALPFYIKVQAQHGPNVLVIMAHPDDETTFAATLYKITKEQHGTVELFTIINGEGGYKYSTLAEGYYGLSLTNEAIGRKNLPTIRKKELQNAGRILGVSRYYFLDQKDAHYTTDEHEPMDTSWNVALIKQSIRKALTYKKYDFIFCLLPEDGSHGQHKAATLLALQTVGELPAASRPIILGSIARNKKSKPVSFNAYLKYQETKTLQSEPDFTIDRTSSFGYNSRLNYKVVVNWEIAEHKLQGVMQMAMNDDDLEEFWYFEINANGGLNKCQKLFEKLKITPNVASKFESSGSLLN